jgi:hypothetical protein
MFKEYWNGYIALGIAVGLSLAFNIVGFLSVGFGWVGLEKATTNTYTYAEQQCTRQQAQHALSPSAVLPNPQATSTEPQADQGDERESAEPDWCDLAAQQSMADSTAGMEQTAWAALGLTTIGVVLVWRTLYYTRKTLVEAEAATSAANRTVEATIQIGHAQMRPWLTFSDVQSDEFLAPFIFFPEPLDPQSQVLFFNVRATVRNTGQSAANNVRLYAFSSTWEQVDENYKEVLKGMAVGDVGAFTGVTGPLVMAPSASENYYGTLGMNVSHAAPDFSLRLAVYFVAKYDSITAGNTEHTTVQVFWIMEGGRGAPGTPVLSKMVDGSAQILHRPSGGRAT